jgi:hypothetical protein
VARVQEQAVVDRLLTDPRFSGWGLPTLPLRRLAYALTALLLLDIAINAADIAALIHWRTAARQTAGLQSGTPDAFNQYAWSDLAAMWNILGFLVLCGLGAAVLTWLYRARCNVDALGLGLVTPQHHRPAWVIACWFVPVVNLLAPYFVVRDIVRAGALRDDGSRSSMAALVLPWWALWLVSLFAGVVSWVRPITGDAAWWNAASGGSEILAALVLLALIWHVTRAQQAAEEPMLFGWSGR